MWKMGMPLEYVAYQIPTVPWYLGKNVNIFRPSVFAALLVHPKLVSDAPCGFMKRGWG
jgi:hypothetical protein